MHRTFQSRNVYVDFVIQFTHQNYPEVVSHSGCSQSLHVLRKQWTDKLFCCVPFPWHTVSTIADEYSIDFLGLVWRRQVPLAKSKKAVQSALQWPVRCEEHCLSRLYFSWRCIRWPLIMGNISNRGLIQANFDATKSHELNIRCLLVQSL